MANVDPRVKRPPAYWAKRARFYAKKYGVDPALFQRQIKQESNFSPTARSPAGALGIAQIVPKWHPGVDPLDPEAALDYAAKHMADQVKKYGNYRDALSVYNSGRPWKEAQGFAETKNYVAKIMGGGKVGQSAAMPKPANIGVPAPGKPVIPAQAMGTLNDLFKKVGLEPLDIVGDLPLSRQQPAPSVPGRTAGPSLAAAAPAQSPAVKLPKLNLMVTAIQKAQQMGLNVTENPYTDGTIGKHVKGSDHYRVIGKRKGKKVGAGVDVSGDPAAMRAFFQWAERYAGKGLNDLFFDPAGYSYDRGKRWDKTIGGHGDHVHFSV